MLGLSEYEQALVLFHDVFVDVRVVEKRMLLFFEKCFRVSDLVR